MLYFSITFLCFIRICLIQAHYLLRVMSKVHNLLGSFVAKLCVQPTITVICFFYDHYLMPQYFH